MGEVKLLDCTLRDGGYLNDWKFGYDNIINIYERLISAGIDIVEIGFIDDRRQFEMDRTIMPDTKSVNKLLVNMKKNMSMIVGMIDYGTCKIENIADAKDGFLDGIRVIFKKHIMKEAIEYCAHIKALGYKVFVQAVSITSYNDDEMRELINMVNRLEPYAFSLVDTYGLLHKKQLMHYYQYADEFLKTTIGIGYHSHNNFQLAYANCIELLESPPKDRLLIIDGTLYGMGKGAGNAPLELLATYMNDNKGKKYHNSQLLEAIDVTILEIYRKIPWGYSFKFFLAAAHDCHPNYVTYLMSMKKLSIKSISEILGSIMQEKKLLYDEEYLKECYIRYQKNATEGSNKIDYLASEIKDKKILLLGPGKEIIKKQKKINQYIEKNSPIIISINFLPEGIKSDYLFISNAKRYVQLSSKIKLFSDSIKLIATSNVTRISGEFDFTLDYCSFLDAEAKIVDNPMIMMLKLLNTFEIKQVVLAGFDGYTKTALSNYSNPNLEYSFSSERAMEINRDVIESLNRLNLEMQVIFLTKSKYEGWNL